MPTLEVNGATIYYETFGSGPLLLLIPGADGRGSVFHNVAEKSDLTSPLCWDRRGYSRSLLKGSQDFPKRLATDADDAQCLILYLSPQQPAIVFDTSPVAIVA